MKKILSPFILISALTATGFSNPLSFSGMALGGSAEVVTLTSSYFPGGIGVYAGKLNFTDGSNTYQTICADAEHLLDGSVHIYSGSMTNPNGATPVDAAGRIVALNFASAVSADQQAGLQIAVWAALYNGTSSFSLTGPLTITGYTGGAYADAVSDFAAATGNIGSAKYLVTSEAGGQSQLTTEAVPEPFSILALGAGIASILRRKRA